MAKKPVIAISNVSHVNTDLLGLPEMDLPTGAEQQGDGSVLLILDVPVTLSSTTGVAELFEHLVLHRLTGADMRKVLDAKDGTKTMLARSLNLAPARLALLYGKMDAADVAAATKVVAEMVGFGEGLPEQAVKNADGSIDLPLLFPVELDDGPAPALKFHRLTGGDLDALKRTTGVQTLLTLLSRALKKPLKEIDALFDGMDGADVVAAQRVAGFLSGNGRLTGR